MGPQQLINVGFGSRFILGVNSKYTEFNKETSLYTGLLFRYGDALAPVIRYEVNKLAFGVSYDFTLSSLFNANRSNGGFEICIAFQPNLHSARSKHKARPRHCLQFFPLQNLMLKATFPIVFLPTMKEIGV